MKKIMAVAAILLMVLALAGCLDRTATKAVEQGKLSMASGDYAQALSYFKLAQNEGNNDAESTDMMRILECYIHAKEALEQNDMDQAAAELAVMPDSYKQYRIASDIDQMRSVIDSKTSVASNVDEQIAAVKKWIASGDYASAALNITELYTKDMTSEQRKTVDEMKSTLETARAKISEAGNAAAASASSYGNSNTDVVATYYVVNCNEWITLRSAPSTSASSLAHIPLGQAVGYIENAGNGFYKINYDGLVGYGLASYLSSTKPGSSAPSVRRAQVVNCNEWITLRSAPSTSASSLARIPLGTYVTYIGSASNGFYCIEYRGMRGYGLQSYLELR